MLTNHLSRVPLVALPLVLVLGALSGTPAESTPRVVEPQAGSSVDKEIRAENQKPGSRSWLAGKRRAKNVARTAAFASRSSVKAGRSVNLHVSTRAKRYRIKAYRMGSYQGIQARLVWRSDWRPGRRQTATGYVARTRTPFARWKATDRLDTTGWPPGMYLIRTQGSNGYDWFTPLVVRHASVKNRLILVMSNTTWQAYNTWGGRSSYTGPGGFAGRSRAVSFSRPFSAGYGTGKYLAYEQPVVALAERSGFPVTYLAMTDLRKMRYLRGAAGIVFLGHAEYWSAKHRKMVTRARNAGTDLAFLGANTMYWRVRMKSRGPNGLPLETIYKSAGEDPVRGRNTTARFRDWPNARPERSLVGQNYECYPATGTYTVKSPKFFAYKGTGIRRNGTVPGIVDVEVDRAYPGRPNPERLQIVALSPVRCRGARTVSTTTYYSTDSGAGVFATGTMGWVLRGLRGDAPKKSIRFTRKVTRNVFKAMVQGQMGRTYPSKGNVSKYKLSRRNTTGAA